jgi:large subunit ribosomal protein L10
MSKETHHVSKKKKEVAKSIQKLILEYPIIAAVNMEGLPAPQLQKMKAQLRGKIELAMTKRRIMKHAIDEIKDKKKNIEKIEEHLKGMPALIFTKENPFSLFKTLKKSKTKAPAKAGQTAPFDIIVPKGPTGFMPGPVIGELAELGIKSGVEDGKVAIKEDSTAVKEGEKISAKAAGILARLGVEPMEVGLNVTAVYADGDIFTASVLDIDEDKFNADLSKAVSGAFNLAINTGYTTKETINVLISKAFNDAKALGLSQEIIDEGIIDALLSKAEGSAMSLKGTANIETVEKPKSQKSEISEGLETKSQSAEPKVEEKKPEVKEAPKVEEKPTPSEQKEEKVLEEEKEIIKEEKKIEKEVESQKSDISEGLEAKPQSKPKIEDPVEKEVKEEVKEEEEKQLEKERIAKEKELEAIAEKKKQEEDEKKKAEEIKKLKEDEKKKQEELRQAEAKRKAEEAKKAEEEKQKQEAEKKIAEEKLKAAEKAKEEQSAKETVTNTDQKIAEMVAKTKKFVKGDVPNAEDLIEEAGKLAAEAPKPAKVEEPKLEVKSQKSEISEGLETKSQSETPIPKKPVPTIQELNEKKAEEKEDDNKNKKEQEEVENLAQELIKKGTLRK